MFACCTMGLQLYICRKVNLPPISSGLVRKVSCSTQFLKKMSKQKTKSQKFSPTNSPNSPITNSMKVYVYHVDKWKQYGNEKSVLTCLIIPEGKMPVNLRVYFPKHQAELISAGRSVNETGLQDVTYVSHFSAQLDVISKQEIQYVRVMALRSKVKQRSYPKGTST